MLCVVVDSDVGVLWLVLVELVFVVVGVVGMFVIVVAAVAVVFFFAAAAVLLHHNGTAVIMRRPTPSVRPTVRNERPLHETTPHQLARPASHPPPPLSTQSRQSRGRERVEKRTILGVYSWQDVT